MDIETYITIVVPTYNRYSFIDQCINSIRQIFQKANIILYDTSTIQNKKFIKNIINKYSNIKYYYNNTLECNIGKIYINAVEKSNTKYTLIVEDDDQIINIQLHKSILLDMLINDIAVYTFAAQQNTVKYLNFDTFNISSINDILIFWNCNFQFGQTYFKTEILKKSLNIWFNFDKLNSFNIYFDEAITLLSIYFSKSYKHNKNVGLEIGINTDNMSWNNVIMSYFSADLFINNMQLLLKDNVKSFNMYKKMLSDEIIIPMNQNITYNLIYNNIFLHNLYNNARNKLYNNAKYKDVKFFIYKTIETYFKVKKIINYDKHK